MFETSVVQAGALQSGGRYRVLTISLFAHSAVILGALAFSVASVDFPAVAPDEMANAPIFMPVQIPPPLGNPNGGAPPRQPEPQRQATPPPAPTQQTAPPVIPDDVPQVDAPHPGDSTTTDSGSTPGTEPGPIGVPWGDPNSPGSLDAPPVINAGPVPDKVYTVGEVKAPVMIHRVEPTYPSAFVRAKMPGKVAVRCIIDKNGRVRDPEIIFATNQAFADAVLRAIAQWRYQPASLQGNAVDCYLDLKVDFGVR